MREILFRGKRCDNGEWAEGDLVRSYLKMGNACITDFAKGVVLGVDNATVGQYTGLTDKNGKKIFEGDIIKIEHDDFAYDSMSIEYRTEQGMVAYDDCGMLGIVVEKYKGTNVWSDFFHILGLTDRIANWTFEIIGNIHDNPELLGGEENAAD